MASESKNVFYIMAGVMVALALWGTYLAIGSYLGLAEGTRGYDLRRGAVVMACMGSFLLFWLALLWYRQRRLNSNDEE